MRYSSNCLVCTITELFATCTDLASLSDSHVSCLAVAGQRSLASKVFCVTNPRQKKKKKRSEMLLKGEKNVAGDRKQNEKILTLK